MKSLANFAAVLAAAAVLAPAAAHAGANLLTNGGFETGDFTGWHESDASNLTSVKLGDYNGVGPSQGQYQAVLGAVGFGVLSQDLVTPVGETFRLTFDLANDAAGFNFFEIEFGAQRIAVCVSCSVFDYRTFSYDLPALDPTTTLALNFEKPPGFWHLDNVSFKQVVAQTSGAPEPASWTLMILGFAAAGGALRASRRHRQIAGA